jgi:hypothetical protein
VHLGPASRIGTAPGKHLAPMIVEAAAARAVRATRAPAPPAPPRHQAAAPARVARQDLGLVFELYPRNGIKVER